MQRNTPVRSTSIVRCHSASVWSVNGFGVGRDAGDVARAQSRPPNRSTAVCTIARDRVRRRRRRRATATASPIDRRACVLIALASSTSATTTLRATLPRTPARSRGRCRCRAPVTSATLPGRAHVSAAPRDTGRAHDQAVLLVRDRTWRARAPRPPSCPSARSQSSGRSIIAVAPSVVTARSGATAFTAMPVALQLRRERLASAVERGLARRVGRRARLLRAVELPGVDDRARDVDDPARAALAHRRARPPW